MKRTFIKESLLAIFVTVLSLTYSFGQTTITTGAVTPNPVCAGSDVSVPYTTTGTVLPAVVFIAQLSDAAGAFGATPTQIGTSATSPITATIPAGTTAGSAYKIRVVSKLGAVIQIQGSESVAITVNAVPAAPTVVSPVNYVQGASADALSATPATGLLWYNGPASASPLPAAPVPSTAAPGTTSYYVSQKVAGCESARAKIDVVVTACTPPAKPTVVTPVSYEVNKPASALQATFLTGAIHNWYGPNATGGTASTTATVPTTNAVGTTSYYVSQTVAGCESERAKIDVTVTACTPPAKPAVVTPVSYVVNKPASALQATFLTGATHNWYGPNATGGTASTTATVPATNAIGTTSYYVSQSVAGCESDRAKIDVTVTACTPPAKPTVVTPVNYIVDKPASALQATFLATAIHNWYGPNATGGTASTTATIPATNAVGTTSYYVSQTLDGCESLRSEIVVNVTACTPSAKPGVADVAFCIGGATTALTATGTALKWYQDAAGGSQLPSAPKPSSDAAGVTSYYVTQTVAPGCESPRAEIKVTIHETATPTATSPVEYCLNEKASPLTATGTDLKWYTIPTGGSALSTTPTPATNVVGTTRYYVSQTVNGCESRQRKEVAVVVKNPSTKPTVTATINLCQNSTATALTATGTELQWYTTETGGTALASAPVPVTTAIGTTSYYVSQTSAGLCEGPRAKIDVVIKDSPAAPAVVTPVNYCIGEKPVALTPSGGVYKWYTGPTGGTGSASAPTPTATVAGTTSYYVSQSNTYGTLSCESPRAKLDVVVNPTPAALPVISDVFCQERTDKNYTFPTQPTNGNTINWYTAASGGTASPSAPTINLKTAGETTYYATQLTSKGCESTTRTALKVRVKPLPGFPGIAQSLIEYCQFIPAKPLEATPVANATLDWYGTAASGGTPSPAAPTPSTAEGGTTSYFVGQTLEGCVGDRAKIDIKVNTTPKPTTKTYLEYCQNAVAPVLDATGTILKWYREANGTDWQGVPFVPFTEKVQDYSFYVTQTGSNGCESPKEEIKIHIKSLPSATISGSSTIDLGQSATINIKFTGDGPWTYVLSGGQTGTTDQANFQVNVKPSTTTSYLVTEVSNACGKGLPIGSALITVKVPTITSGSPSIAEACASKTFSLPFQQSGDFPAGNTFKVQISKENTDSKFYTIPSVASSNVVVATLPDTTKGASYFVRVISSGTNPDFTVKGSVSSITLNVSPLPVATLTGTQTILVGESADLKADITGKSPWTFTLNNGTKDTLITANASPYTFKLKPKTTTTYAITKVTNSCGTGTGVGTARVQVDPILGVEPPAPADWAKVYPTLIQDKCTVDITGTISPKQASIEVIDLNGRVRATNPVRQKTTEVNFGNYPSGLYLLRIQNGNLSTVQRVMKP
ncbi:T9SS type A sorting domain-containing protein [Dyadobacter sp. MSC1_007]|jgi:hypothetical protein|uniref:T9SS type A sorting domain-containing protein n=1 Tax=Dyadobacter sp. MSC1_007 TaxID=2909264 RepID=UPI00202F6CAA|nr:T9SS type A sorting domain-containing protein [Dyadobacter sp. MSC1_007]